MKTLTHGKGRIFFSSGRNSILSMTFLSKNQTFRRPLLFFSHSTLVSSLCRSVRAAHFLETIRQPSLNTGKRKTPLLNVIWKNFDYMWVLITHGILRLQIRNRRGKNVFPEKVNLGNKILPNSGISWKILLLTQQSQQALQAGEEEEAWRWRGGGGSLGKADWERNGKSGRLRNLSEATSSVDFIYEILVTHTRLGGLNEIPLKG